MQHGVMNWEAPERKPQNWDTLCGRPNAWEAPEGSRKLGNPTKWDPPKREKTLGNPTRWDPRKDYRGTREGEPYRSRKDPV